MLIVNPFIKKNIVCQNVILDWCLVDVRFNGNFETSNSGIPIDRDNTVSYTFRKLERHTVCLTIFYKLMSLKFPL